MHRAMAEKIRGNPALLDIAREYLARWYPTAGSSQPYLDEWKRLIDGPPDRGLAMTQDHERCGRCGNVVPLPEF